jgi:hypothetical protein
VSLASASACVRANLLHVDDATAILLDSCVVKSSGELTWIHSMLPDLPRSARDEVSAICTAHGGPWCAYLESVRHEHAGELSLACALVLATALMVVAVRRRAAWLTG